MTPIQIWQDVLYGFGVLSANSLDNGVFLFSIIRELKNKFPDDTKQMLNVTVYKIKPLVNLTFSD